MTEAQRDDLITELSLQSSTQIRKIVAEYIKLPKSNACEFPFYEFLKEKLEIEGDPKNVSPPDLSIRHRSLCEPTITTIRA
jgi:hypothetical protein